MKKITLRLVAAAAALVAATSAHADLTGFNTGNGSLTLYAYNTVTRAYYIRDTGMLLNDFLPSSVTTAAGDGGVTGTRTPEAGLTLNSSTNASFADASFSSWLTGQTTSDIRWALVAGDSLSTGGGVQRLLSTSALANVVVSNGQVGNAVGGANIGNLPGLAGAFGLSTSATSGAPTWMTSNGGIGANTLASLDQGVGLYYFARNTGSTAVQSTTTRFGNTTGYAVVTLEADGDLTYVLAGEPVSSVPVPAAAWLLGSGLLGLGGMVRRRKAAAQA